MDIKVQAIKYKGKAAMVDVSKEVKEKEAQLAKQNAEIEKQNRFDQTFLIVTHNEELAKMSDRVLHMKDGRII